jgi:hypothetical protein
MTATVTDAPRAAGAERFRYDLALYRGDTAAWRFRFWADEGRTVPYDLDGMTAAAQIRSAPDSHRAVDLRCEIELPNVISVDLDAAESARAPSGFWDLEVTRPADPLAAGPLLPLVRTLVTGAVTVHPDVTRL